MLVKDGKRGFANRSAYRFHARKLEEGLSGAGSEMDMATKFSICEKVGGLMPLSLANCYAVHAEALTSAKTSACYVKSEELGAVQDCTKMMCCHI